jgi:hypothetical protein
MWHRSSSRSVNSVVCANEEYEARSSSNVLMLDGECVGWDEVDSGVSGTERVSGV